MTNDAYIQGNNGLFLPSNNFQFNYKPSSSKRTEEPVNLLHFRSKSIDSSITYQMNKFKSNTESLGNLLDEVKAYDFDALILVAGPGAGKGTQIRNMQNEGYAINHLSTGDCFREILSNKNSYGLSELAISTFKKIGSHYMEKGDLVPNEITNTILAYVMIDKYKSNELSSNELIGLDGWPRNIQQADEVGKLFNPIGVLYFDVSEENLIHRMEKRAKTENRNDNGKEFSRIQKFINESLPVVDYLNKNSSMPILKINGNQDVKKVTNDTLKELDSIGTIAKYNQNRLS